MSSVDSPFEILERVSNYAYNVDLPSDYGISSTFNVVDLSPLLGR